jgi:hypothetical protein
VKKLTICLVLLFAGCVGSPEPRHPYRDGRSTEKSWWTTPYTAQTPRDENPWLKYVHPNPLTVNEFDPWANDDLQRYSASPVVVPGEKVERPDEGCCPPEEDAPAGQQYY